jgi:FlaA1/EpsC-like NDP-sugar epimerase
VLQAAALARDSEVFLLDMGDPVRIEDLARRLIRLAGLIPNEDIRVEFTGMRPGEKLSETLANGPVNMTDHPKIFEVPLAHPGAGTLADAVAELEEYALSEDTDHLLPLLSSLAQGTLARRTQVMDDRIIESSASWS